MSAILGGLPRDGVNMVFDTAAEHKKFAYVAERDIDLLLLEELSVNRDFAAWMCSAFAPALGRGVNCVDARHSVTHPAFGESDLVAIYDGGFALLIENKLDAPAQPDQALRYRQRGEEGRRQGHWQRFLTCVVAPERYLATNVEAQSYEARLSYEAVRDWFREQADTRSEYRAYVLNEAIEQNRRGYSPVPDDDVTRFWFDYWMFATERFPALEMPEPGPKPGNSDWPDFRPSVLGNAMNIVHKMAQGHVDLQFRGAADRVAIIRSAVKDPGLQVVSAGKSAAIRVSVPPVDRFVNFQGQRERVIVALEAAERLLHLARELGSSI